MAAKTLRELLQTDEALRDALDTVLERSDALSFAIQTEIDNSSAEVRLLLRTATEKTADQQTTALGLCQQILWHHLHPLHNDNAVVKHFRDEADILLKALLLKWALSKPEVQWCAVEYPVNAVQMQIDGPYVGASLGSILDGWTSVAELARRLCGAYSSEVNKKQNPHRQDLLGWLLCELKLITPKESSICVHLD